MEKKAGVPEDDRNVIYQLEGRPRFSVAFPLGLQHVLSMFIGNLAPALVLAGIASDLTGEPIISSEQRMLMVQCCMFASRDNDLDSTVPLKTGQTVPNRRGFAPSYGYSLRLCADHAYLRRCIRH
ncbi:MAG: hypothetical protein LBC51_02590 [Treponema sp.]|jgi:hypothetical protein|nr:hypothetical protein [Treponema sp.]